MIDLRSDTVTKPTRAMRQAMAEAEVGDDVIGFDPTVERLEARTAELLGKPAAIFMPSGSMTNQVAVRLHCDRGSEFLCEAGCHIFNYEQAAFAQLSGIVASTIPGTDGVLTVDQFEGKIRPVADHLAETRLVCLENTHNRAGGVIQPLETVAAICRWAAEHGLRRHLDGARLWNAIAATGVDAATWAQHFDSVSVCYSKGLGAPVGSALVGEVDFIRQARRARKLFGGGMRQVGMIAAGALYAMEHHCEDLKADHEKAQLLAAAVEATETLSLPAAGVQTNIVIIHVDAAWGTAAQLVERLEAAGVRCMAFGPQAIRLVTHRDLTHEEVAEAAEILQRVVAEDSHVATAV